MAVATKWSGGLALVAAALIIVVAWLLQRRAARRAAAAGGRRRDARPRRRTTSVGPPPSSRTRRPSSRRRRRAPPRAASRPIAAALVAVPVAIYLLSYAQYFATGHTLADFRELHRQMVTFNLNLKATHTYASLAPTWIVDYRPVWYYFEGTKTYRGVIAIGNPFLWWLATLSLVAAVVLALLRRSYALLPAAAIVVVLYVPWFLDHADVVPLLHDAGGAVHGHPRGRGAVPASPAACCRAAAGSRRRPPRSPPPSSGGRVGIGAGWLFWTLPRRAGDSLGWVGVAVGVAPRARRPGLPAVAAHARATGPWTAMVVAGLAIGIVVGVRADRARAAHLPRVLRAHHVVPELDLSTRRGGAAGWAPTRPPRPASARRRGAAPLRR